MNIRIPMLDAAVSGECSIPQDRFMGVVPSRFEVPVLVVIDPGAELALDDISICGVMDQTVRVLFPRSHRPSLDPHRPEGSS